MARYRYTFRLHRAWRPPVPAGSCLRGVFGHALLELACTCPPNRAVHAPDCPYRSLFEAPADARLNKSQQQTPPQPYVLFAPVRKEICPADGLFSFEIRLFGQARLLLPMVTAAWRRAFAKGVGAAAVSGSLFDLAVWQNGVWQSLPVSGTLPPHQQRFVLKNDYPKNLTLDLITPLRVVRNGKPLRAAALDRDVLLRQLFRRVRGVSALYWPQDFAADYHGLMGDAAAIRSVPQLHWRDFKRYSNRQQRAVPLGGLMGQWHLENVPPQWAALLDLGQWLHIGKETVFGLGAYRIRAA
ncbi:CRISPR system precrRNA processing endoribonuclease RAMP protein Cas6 [Conchiformibius kuhniae]|uniref:CRISPR system precrRNA processing endoribonuclease RAMP protein Cas6 n=1 Tax=Conchiformibius kuhniae TaxID=211502 RepID=A0A8T9MVV2_9NEIS